MGRTVTITQANRLGDRLRKAPEPEPDDLLLLQSVLADHAEPIAQVQDVLSSLGYQSTARLKTTGTILDKLIRDKTRLGKMQDLAGARVVRNVNLVAQDRIVRRIVNSFEGSVDSDLRQKPRSGYRAVHVIIPVEDCKVEVQVRTEMQDLWANLVESFEGELGRDIRYGGKPLRPRKRVAGIVSIQTGRVLTQAQLVRGLLSLSRLVAALEEGKTLLNRSLREADPTLYRKLQRDSRSTEKEVRSLFEGVLRYRRRRQ